MTRYEIQEEKYKKDLVKKHFQEMLNVSYARIMSQWEDQHN